MSRRARLISFGSAGILVLAGALCAALVPGTLGQLLTFVLMSLGLGGAVLLVFLEVGLSEDRDRAAEQERQAREHRQREAEDQRRSPRRSRESRWRRRPR